MNWKRTVVLCGFVGWALQVGGRTASAFKQSIHSDITTVALATITVADPADGATLRFLPKATDEVARANYHTDSIWDLGDPSDSFRHFDNELFSAGSQRLIELREQIIASITASEPDGTAARQTLGQAIHSLQDFYAHSNWVEMIAHGSRPDGIDTRLGRQVIPDTGAGVVVCGTDTGVLEGAGLTTLTSGYYVGLCGDSPSPLGKCRHGQDLCPGSNHPGINKDSASRAGHGKARALATAATIDFVSQVILDDPRVRDNSRAIHALLGIRRALAMVIDDTGSMGTDIGGIKTQVALMVNDLVTRDQEPEEYVLVRFGDPDVGPPVKTKDSATFLAAVNALSADGGGDCPEKSQTALLQAIDACPENSTVFLFTDASAKDASLAGGVRAAATRKNIRIDCLLTGSCSPIDPAYIDASSGTGGQLFFLQKSEIPKMFALVQPELAGDLVDIALAEGTLSGTTRTISVPVDATVTTVVFSAYVDAKLSVTVKRPSGAFVTTSDADATVTDLTTGGVVTVRNPAAGLWTFALQGTGAYSMAVRGNSPIELAHAEFIESMPFAHGALDVIPGQPGVGSNRMMAAMLGGFSTIAFHLVDLSGAVLADVSLLQGALDAPADAFVGSVSLPSGPVRLLATGTDAGGASFQRVFRQDFESQSVVVHRDPASRVGSVSRDMDTTVSFIVTNLGSSTDSFSMVASDVLGAVGPVTPAAVTLDAGASATVSVQVTPPVSTPVGATDLLTVRATSQSSASTTNSATLELKVVGDPLLDLDAPLVVGPTVVDGVTLPKTSILAFRVRASSDEDVALQSLSFGAGEANTVELEHVGNLQLYADADGDGQPDDPSLPLATRSRAAGTRFFAFDGGLPTIPAGGEQRFVLMLAGRTSAAPLTAQSRAGMAVGAMPASGSVLGALALALAGAFLASAVLARRRHAGWTSVGAVALVLLLPLLGCGGGSGGSDPVVSPEGTLPLALEMADVVGVGTTSGKTASVNGSAVQTTVTFTGP